MRAIGTAFAFQYLLDLLQFGFGQMFDADEVVARGLDRTDQFVELGLDRGAVTVLGILDQEASQRVVAKNTRLKSPDLRDFGRFCECLTWVVSRLSALVTLPTVSCRSLSTPLCDLSSSHV